VKVKIYINSSAVLALAHHRLLHAHRLLRHAHRLLRHAHRLPLHARLHLLLHHLLLRLLLVRPGKLLALVDGLELLLTQVSNSFQVLFKGHLTLFKRLLYHSHEVFDGSALRVQVNQFFRHLVRGFDDLVDVVFVDFARVLVLVDKLLHHAVFLGDGLHARIDISLRLH
jgi:hypothetical protein